MTLSASRLSCVNFRENLILVFQLRDLEAELELEQRRSREVAAHNRKLERQMAEIRVQAEDDHRVRVELQDQASTLTMPVRLTR